MKNEKLIVKNFGPIREAELDLKKVTVLIGEQASGKSVLAKLVAMFHNHSILENEDKRKNKWWNYQFKYYALDDFFPKDKNSATIQFENNDYWIQFEKIKMQLEYKNERLAYIIKTLKSLEKKQDNIDEEISQLFEKEEYERATELEAEKTQNRIDLIKLRSELKQLILSSEYIPAERVVISYIRCRHFEDLYFDDFIETFNEKRAIKNNIKIYPLNVEYKFIESNEEDEDGENVILVPNSEISFPLYKASSGIQSLVPLQVILEAINPKQKYLFIIEEPELNLYPSSQKLLIEYIIEKCTKGDNRLIITTHSPYILTALNNLIQAKNVVKKNPDLAQEVNNIIPPQYQIDFEDVAAYFVADGTVRSIMNIENQLIDANALDEVSNDIGEEFGKLVQLEFQNELL